MPATPTVDAPLDVPDPVLAGVPTIVPLGVVDDVGVNQQAGLHSEASFWIGEHIYRILVF